MTVSEANYRFFSNASKLNPPRSMLLGGGIRELSFGAVERRRKQVYTVKNVRGLFI
jgi:hypothetical protein